jgi:hypothetical protein
MHNNINHFYMHTQRTAHLTLYGSLKINHKKANAELIMTLCITGGLRQNGG